MFCSAFYKRACCFHSSLRIIIILVTSFCLSSCGSWYDTSYSRENNQSSSTRRYYPPVDNDSSYYYSYPPVMTAPVPPQPVYTNPSYYYPRDNDAMYYYGYPPINNNYYAPPPAANQYYYNPYARPGVMRTQPRGDQGQGNSVNVK